MYATQEIPQIDTLDRAKGEFPDGNYITFSRESVLRLVLEDQ